MPIEPHRCKICTSASLIEIPEYRSLPRVTSDCVAFRSGGRLLVCPACGATQSPSDEQWFEEIREIYSDYHAYHQASGVEQHVIDPLSGELRRRSEVLVDGLLGLPGVPRSGKVLDVGCGTGATLRSFSERGGWRLYGQEMDRKNIHFLTALAGFESLYTDSPAGLPGQFDLITMVHALEHFPEPAETLRGLRSKIAPGGRIFVEVPNAEANTFDYVIADHMMHFTRETLAAVATRAGFAIDCLSTVWVTKELSLTARPGPAEGRDYHPNAALGAVDRVRAQVDWLRRFVDASRQASATSAAFGLFGTSIAATWLAGVLGDVVSFFVEEDPNRVGRLYLGSPVISPQEVKPGSVVYLALTPPIAAQVALRLRATIADLRLPPPIN
ncbi:MAG: class I SAM-dependent methyltransferase [Bryobacteraceae bacterium]